MSSHFLLMVLFALFVSVVFATMMRDRPQEQAMLFGQLFAAFIVGGVLLGWLIFPLPL